MDTNKKGIKELKSIMPFLASFLCNSLIREWCRYKVYSGVAGTLSYRNDNDLYESKEIGFGEDTESFVKYCGNNKEK